VPEPKPDTRRFVVLPPHGIRAAAPAVRELLAHLDAARTFATARTFAAVAGMRPAAPRLRVVDSVREDGAKLVEMTPEAANELKANQPGLRIVPEVFFRPARARYEVASKVRAAAVVRVTVAVRSKADGRPVKGATVVAFTDFAPRVGAQAVTGAGGTVRLNLGGATRVERLFVYPPPGFWGAFRRHVAARGPVAVALAPIDFGFPDGVRHFYGNAGDATGTGVTVGVVDTGVGPHPHLDVAGGRNTVAGESEADFADTGDGHGTHVAGIIAGRGRPPDGARGLAPGVSLRAYRVFGAGAGGASNFAILKAIDRAVGDGCDLVNLSLGGGPRDPAVASAVHDARAAGTLVVAAAGNDGRGPVAFPAADPLCLAVSALGVKGTFPRWSVEEGDVLGPFGTTDPNEFVAAFSNVGPEIDLTGPGVGVVSTVPGGYVPMSGTSMACPAVVGFAARLLAAAPAVLAMPRTQERSDAVARLVLLAARKRGFPPAFEGSGLPGE
jgi:subtilisin